MEDDYEEFERSGWMSVSDRILVVGRK
jgi:hypothetical protein